MKFNGDYEYIVGNSEYFFGCLFIKLDLVDEKQEKKLFVVKDVEGVESYMIIYKGVMIDLESLMVQLERSEKIRVEMEKQMIEVNKEKGSYNVICINYYFLKDFIFLNNKGIIFNIYVFFYCNIYESSFICIGM